MEKREKNVFVIACQDMVNGVLLWVRDKKNRCVKVKNNHFSVRPFIYLFIFFVAKMNMWQKKHWIQFNLIKYAIFIRFSYAHTHIYIKKCKCEYYIYLIWRWMNEWNKKNTIAWQKYQFKHIYNMHRLQQRMIEFIWMLNARHTTHHTTPQIFATL